MKKNLLLIGSLLFSVLSLNAQPIITAPSLSSVIGQVYHGQHAMAEGVSIGTTGANQVWDYTNLIDSGAEWTLTMIDTSASPYDTAYPNSNCAGIYSFDTTTEFFNLTSAMMGNNGGVTTSGDITYFQTPVAQLVYPFTYNTYYQGTFNGYYFSNTGGGTISGVDTLEADGYGTLKLPAQTFTNVIRSRSQFNQAITYTGYTININTTWYDYIMPGYNYLLLEVAISSTTFGANTTTVTVVTYSKDVAVNAVPNVDNGDAIGMYPNPSNGSFSVSIPQGQLNGADVIVTNLLGQKVMESKMNTPVQKFNLEGVAKGIYMVNINTENGNACKKLVVE